MIFCLVVLAAMLLGGLCFRKIGGVIALILLLCVTISCCNIRYSDNRQMTKKPIPLEDRTKMVRSDALEIPIMLPEI